MSHKVDSVKSILYALGANSAIALAKFVAAICTGSGSMMAEAIHSFADTGNQLLLLLGIKLAKRPPSDDFPLGHGKAIYFWSFIVALILFTMGGVFSVYEGVHKIYHPESLDNVFLAFGVLLFAIIAESISMWGCMREVRKELRDRSIFNWFRETRKSDLLVIFGEDTAALLGLGIAFFAVLMTVLTGNPIYDAFGSVMIGVLLVFVAVLIGNEVKSLLIGQGVDAYQRAEMLACLRQCPQIDHVFNLITLRLGEDIMIAVKAKMVPTQSANEMIDAINSCEATFKEAFPDVMWMFFEPDLQD